MSGKLVRDKIPQIIQASGEQPIIRIASPAEHRALLRAKLREEVEEFLTSDGDPEELADILEVVYALADDLGVDRAALEEARRRKADQRGGFAGRVVWSGNRGWVAPPGATQPGRYS